MKDSLKRTTGDPTPLDEVLEIMEPILKEKYNLEFYKREHGEGYFKKGNKKIVLSYHDFIGIHVLIGDYDNNKFISLKDLIYNELPKAKRSKYIKYTYDYEERTVQFMTKITLKQFEIIEKEFPELI